jgi:hypothetical protein
MVGIDAAKARTIASVTKTALKLAAQPSKDGKPIRVGFACAPGKTKADHVLMIDARRKGPALLAEIVKLAKDRKILCCGSARVTLDGKPTLWVAYKKPMQNGERLITEALKALNLQYVVKLDKAPGPAEQDDGEDEADEADGEAAATAPAATDGKMANGKAEAAKPGALQTAPQLWRKTRSFVDLAVKKLKTAVREEYKEAAPEVATQLDKAWVKVDRILESLDDSLALTLEKAAKASSDGARQAELGKAKLILAKYIKYTQGEPLIGQLDDNPFGVELNLKKAIAASLRQLAQSVS